MNWFRIEVQKWGGDGSHRWVGSTGETLKQLAEMVSRGDFIWLNDLLYMDDQGDIKDWSNWDQSMIPTVAINPKMVISMMQFKGDPRKTPRK